MTDVRHAVRALLARPLSSLVIVLTFALGLGATTALVSVAQGLVFSSPPFERPDRLVRVTTRRGDRGGGAVASPEFDEIRALPMVVRAAMYTDQGMYNASGFGTPEELAATITTHDLFAVLGVPPAVGRVFPASYDRTRNFGLVISHGLWVRRFNRDPAIVGRTMTLDGADGYTIHGVMPPGFAFPAEADLYRSSGIAADPAYYARRDARDRVVLVRLTDTATVESLRGALDVLAARLASEYPSTNQGLRFDAMPLSELYTGHLRPFVALLGVAVTFVLLVACVNVGNLLLSRALDRDREMATRAALGATRARLARLLMVEGSVLAVVGALLGAGLAVVAVRAIPRVVPVRLPPWMHVDPDWRTGLYLLLVVLVTAGLTGVMPAWRGASANLHGTIKDGARGATTGAGFRRLRDALVVGEVALALTLLVGAGLLLRTTRALQQVDPGIDTRNALTFRVELGWAAYGSVARTTPFHDEVARRLRALPGVEAVTFDTNLPLSGKPRDPVAIRLPAQSRDEEGRNPYVDGHIVGPDFFEVSRVGLIRGRAFDTRDTVDSEPAVVVSAPLARRLWPGAEAVGQRLQYQATYQPTRWYTVVGVAAPTRHHELDVAPGYDVYQAYTQVTTSGPYYLVRTTGDPRALAQAATGIIGAVDPNQSYLDVQTYEQRVANRLWQRRLAGLLFAGFALLGLLLAVIGLYGVLAESVHQQRREIGVRLALGAQRHDVVTLVGWRGLRLAGAGTVLGVGLALVLGRSIAHVLHGVEAFDPVTLIAAAGVLLSTAAVATYAPTRRALSVPPSVALRTE